METLPVEMVEEIARQLTPQDLARCSAVCREWHEIFNQDWMWKPHCDPELEEPLRTIPCVATPVFVAPEVENSTLSPITHWKLAFMREKHLWKNWRCKEKMEYKEENVINFENKCIFYLEFLTDTLVVAGYSNHIEVLDVSVVPAALVAKTVVNVDAEDELRAIGPNMVLLEKDYSIEVFNVDLMNRSITLKNSISLHCGKKCDGEKLVTKEHFYLEVNNEELKLVIVDLNTGEILKEEQFPVKVNQNDRVSCSTMGFPNSNLVVVAFLVFIEDCDEYCEYYIYSPKELTFLPGPVAVTRTVDSVALLDHWLAVIDDKTLKVYNIHSREVLLSRELVFGWCGTYMCNNSFIFVGYGERKSWVKRYLPLDRSLATLCEKDFGSNRKIFEVVNNKFVVLFGESLFAERVWKPLAKSVEKCDISVACDCIINRSFTKMLNSKYLENSGTIAWYVSSLW